MQKKCAVCKIVEFVALIGALNWGLAGLLNKNWVTHLLGNGTAATRAVYIVIGACGLLSLIGMFVTYPCCKKCCKPA